MLRVTVESKGRSKVHLCVKVQSIPLPTGRVSIQSVTCRFPSSQTVLTSLCLYQGTPSSCLKDHSYMDFEKPRIKEERA